jgi:fructose-specific phosphotransferase system IIC component
MGSGFISGMYNGFLDGVENQGRLFSEIKIDQLILAIFIGLVILVITVGGIFLFMRWGFRRLYGNYIHKLKATLKELQGIDE